MLLSWKEALVFLGVASLTSLMEGAMADALEARQDCE